MTTTLFIERPAVVTSRGGGLRTSTQLILITCAALFFRLPLYLSNRSMWYDEAALTLNLMRRNFRQLLRPLEENQVAPAGFLWVEKIIGHFSGYHEMALRLWPFIAGIALFPIFFLIARRLVGSLPAWIGVLLLIPEKRMINYCDEIKPYTGDALIAILLLYAIWHAGRRRWPMKWMIILAIAGAAAEWVSFPAILVLAGAGLCMAIYELRDRQWDASIKLCILGAVWAISFVLHRACIMHARPSDPFLQSFWADMFMPFPPRSMHDVLWPLRALRRTFADGIRLGVPEIAAGMFVLSCFIMARTHRRLLVFLLAPLLPSLVASAMHQYPFGDRLLAYAFPSIILIIATAIAWVGRQFRSHGKWCIVAVLALLMIDNTAQAFLCIVHPWQFEEIKPILLFMADHQKPGDVVYLYPRSYVAFDCYAARFGLDRLVTLRESSRDLTVIQADIRSLPRANSRLWILLAHGRPETVKKETALCGLADAIGVQVAHPTAAGVAAYLYDLKPKDSPPDQTSTLVK